MDPLWADLLRVHAGESAEWEGPIHGAFLREYFGDGSPKSLAEAQAECTDGCAGVTCRGLTQFRDCTARVGTEGLFETPDGVNEMTYMKPWMKASEQLAELKKSIQGGKSAHREKK